MKALIPRHLVSSLEFFLFKLATFFLSKNTLLFIRIRHVSNSLSYRLSSDMLHAPPPASLAILFAFAWVPRRLYEIIPSYGKVVHINRAFSTDEVDPTGVIE